MHAGPLQGPVAGRMAVDASRVQDHLSRLAEQGGRTLAAIRDGVEGFRVGKTPKWFARRRLGKRGGAKHDSAGADSEKNSHAMPP